MPEISRFYGIVIKMFFDDHNPPHFHALYGEYEVLIDINTFAVIGRNVVDFDVKRKSRSGRRGFREGNRKGTSRIRTARDRNIPTVGLDNCPGQTQTQADAGL